MPEKYQVQQKPRAKRPGRMGKAVPWVRLVIAIIFVTLILVIAIFNIQASLIIGILGVVVGLLQWLLPLSQEHHSVHTASSNQLSSNEGATPKADIRPNQERTNVIKLLYQSSPAVSPISNTVFLFNEPLTDSSEFFGRVRERTTLINRVRKGSSTSIVGSRKIGKTWLMSYLELVAPLEFNHRTSICYIDASMPSCKTVAGFTAIVLEKLGVSITQAKQGLTKLEKVIRELKLKMVVPVICIDEFESFGNRQEFDLDFYRGLRALTQLGLCLVVASKAPLIDIVGENGNTSGFFNVFEQLTLKPFDPKEAEEFVHIKGSQAGFTDQKQLRLLQHGQEAGGYPPIRLQLVGKLLLEDKAVAFHKDPYYYRPDDPSYWREFEERFTEKYQAVVH